MSSYDLEHIQQENERRKARRRAAADAHKRKEILAAASKVIAQRGREGLTLHLVAAEAGYLPGAVYHYFGKKADLLTALDQRSSPGEPEAANTELEDDLTWSYHSTQSSTQIGLADRLKDAASSVLGLSLFVACLGLLLWLAVIIGPIWMIPIAIVVGALIIASGR